MIKNIVSRNGRQNDKMKMLVSKVRWLVVSAQIIFLGITCRAWVKWSSGIGVAINPDNIRGTRGITQDSHTGSLGSKLESI